MSFIPPTCAEITLTWSVATATEPIVSVFGVSDNTALGVEVVASRVAVALATNILPLLADNMEISQLRAVSGGGQEFEIEGVGSGGLAYAAAPPAVCHLINKRTGNVGRANKGRWFLPGVDEGACDSGGHLTTVRRAAINAALDDFRDELSAQDVPMVVLHAVEGPNADAVTTLQCQSRVATLKQRQR